MRAKSRRGSQDCTGTSSRSAADLRSWASSSAERVGRSLNRARNQHTRRPPDRVPRRSQDGHFSGRGSAARRPACGPAPTGPQASRPQRSELRIRRPPGKAASPAAIVAAVGSPARRTAVRSWPGRSSSSHPCDVTGGAPPPVTRASPDGYRHPSTDTAIHRIAGARRTSATSTPPYRRSTPTRPGPRTEGGASGRRHAEFEGSRIKGSAVDSYSAGILHP